jgi:trehalose 6-phosphate phosphatase
VSTVDAIPWLFGDAGLAALRAFVDRATLLAFDLDGTLAPIVDTPSRARIPGPVRLGLVRLGALGPVAIVTGRACADARAHLGFTPRHLVGNHGAEGLPGREASEGGFVRQCRDWDRQLRRLLPARGNPGLVRENKGASISIHYRAAPDREAARLRILQAAGRLEPLARRVPGDCVENLVPRDAPDKGLALVTLMEHAGYGRALFVGDDETDEDVFRRRDERILGIGVGDHAGTSARFRIRAQDEIGHLLEALVDALERGRGVAGP